MSTRTNHRTFDVIVEHNATDNVWYGHVAGEPRAHTFGRTIAALHTNLEEVIELWYELEPGHYDVIDRLEGLDAATDVIDRLGEARQWLADAQDTVNRVTHEAADILVNKEGLSLRDAGNLLGLSHQRVDQLLHGQARSA